MKRTLTGTAALCLLLVALIALAIAPAATACRPVSPVIRWTAQEAFAEPPNIVAQKVVGDITIIKMANHLVDYDAVDPSGAPFPAANSDIYTKGTWVVDSAFDSVMHGTYRSYGADGSVWRGEWAGTMNMATYAMDFVGWGRCIAGPYRGYLLSSHSAGPGGDAPVVGTYTAIRLGWWWMK